MPKGSHPEWGFEMHREARREFTDESLKYNMATKRTRSIKKMYFHETREYPALFNVPVSR